MHEVMQKLDHLIEHAHHVMQQNDVIISQNKHIIAALKIDDREIVDQVNKLRASRDALLKAVAKQPA